MSIHNGDDKSLNIEPELLTAYALGELEGEERAAVEALLNQPGGEALRREVDQNQRLADQLAAMELATAAPTRNPDLLRAVKQRLANQPERMTPEIVEKGPQRGRWRFTAIDWAVVGLVAALFAALMLPAQQAARESARRVQSSDAVKALARAEIAESRALQQIRDSEMKGQIGPAESASLMSGGEYGVGGQLGTVMSSGEANMDSRALQMMVTPRIVVQEEEKQSLGIEAPANDGLTRTESRQSGQRQLSREAKPDGAYPEQLELGFQVENPPPGAEFKARAREEVLADVQELQKLTQQLGREHPATVSLRRKLQSGGAGTEQYTPIHENHFLSPLQQPLSTFSIDVDTASYANVRRFLMGGRLPPADSVRIEELVNYFRYDYPQPKEEGGRAGETPAPRGVGVSPAREKPFSVNMEVAECPWREGHWVLRVGLKGREIARTKRPPSNLVFLLDVSGSMADANKLPLLKTAMKMLAGELGEDDVVSIVTYAGDAGLKLPPTRGNQQRRIAQAIDSLSAGGSTNGSAGIELAYQQAAANFLQEGANRVILCTDGDLNVGVTSDQALVKLIKEKAKGGTFLTVLGFGEGNLQDGKLEKLADNGNGLYAYIDSVREARKVLVEQLTGSTITIAKDVKIQIEFNPAQVSAYRQLGYENRVLAAHDFKNDKKDAGEIGAGHTVTALYELVPAGTDGGRGGGVDPLKYQASEVQGPRSKVQSRIGEDSTPAMQSELLTLKLRYKEPDGDSSKLLEYPLLGKAASFHSASTDFQFAAAVASFGMILRGSEHRGSSNLSAVAEIASAALGQDAGGYRAEFVDLVRRAHSMAR